MFQGKGSGSWTGSFLRFKEPSHLISSQRQQRLHVTLPGGRTKGPIERVGVKRTANIRRSWLQASGLFDPVMPINGPLVEVEGCPLTTLNLPSGSFQTSSNSSKNNIFNPFTSEPPRWEKHENTNHVKPCEQDLGSSIRCCCFLL